MSFGTNYTKKTFLIETNWLFRSTFSDTAKTVGSHSARFIMPKRLSKLKNPFTITSLTINLPSQRPLKVTKPDPYESWRIRILWTFSKMQVRRLLSRSLYTGELFWKRPGSSSTKTVFTSSTSLFVRRISLFGTILC